MRSNNVEQYLVQKVSTPHSLKRGAALTFGLVVFSVVMLFFIPWQQTTFGMGRVVAFAPLDRQQFIEAPVEGRVSRWLVNEGAHVKAGDIVLEMSDNDPDIIQRLQQERIAVENRIRAAEARVESLRSRIASLEESLTNAVEAAENRRHMAAQRVTAAEQALEAAEAQYTTAKINYERQKELEQKGLTSRRNLELAELEYKRSETELERARASLNAARVELSAFLAERNRTRTDISAQINEARGSLAAAMSELASAKAALPQIELRLARQAAQVVRSPRSGTIVRFLVKQGGELLKPGDPVAILIPDSAERAVELFIDGNDIPLISVGRQVRLQFQGWPALQLSGWPGLAFGTFGGTVALVDVTDNGTGKFRVLVVPDENDEEWPPEQYLRQGVRAKGWIFLNRVSLGYEIWRIFNNFPPEIPHLVEEFKKKYPEK
ncbi:MAG: HlyD family secretion protein [Leptospiraceae bacterium]|nr:HlyD family secretion protein [Leptospiraceae bacterium]MDW8307313.1 HlyD family efflux transporter periplasmic adaptor subunit [Leptospiraceae bacterium]